MSRPDDPAMEFMAHDIAEHVVAELRKDRVSGLEPRDIVQWLSKPPDNAWDIFRTVDVDRLFHTLAKLVCPPMCVGFVNDTAWHELCEQKAQDAIRALGLEPPPLTPRPGDQQTETETK